MIQSVSRALDILTIVSDAKGKPIKLNAIAQKAGLNGSTCTHLVQTLCEKGFLSQVSRSAGYVLGAYPYYLTRYRTFQRELINTCNPALRWIQRRTGHTAILAILVDVEKFVISYAEDGKDILHERGDLYRGNLYDSATGRAMLSAMRHTELTQLVKKIGLPSQNDWPEIDSLETLERNLRIIAANKIVCIENIVDGKYDAIYGVSIRAPRMNNCAIGLHVRQDHPPTEEERSRYRDALLSGAKEINRRLRFEEEFL